MKLKLFFALLVIAFVGVGFRTQIATHTKALLLVSEEFPQIPVKPLGLITKTPEHKMVSIINGSEVVGDLFLPKKLPAPALILAMGVRTQEKDKPIILHFAQTMTRLGYVVLWPRLKTLDRGVPSFEEPETFIAAFEYLEKQNAVDPKKISFIGFSVGSSIAMAAAEDPKISDRVYGLVFFGGYYNAFDYITSLATKTTVFDGKEASWLPADGAVNHLEEIFEQNKAEAVKVFEAKSRGETVEFLSALSQDELLFLRKLSPSENMQNFKARIFILHDKGDSYVPYTESIKLSKALPKDREQTFLLSNLFEHVQPQKGLSPKIAGEILKVYGFLYKVLSFL